MKAPASLLPRSPRPRVPAYLLPAPLHLRSVPANGRMRSSDWPSSTEGGSDMLLQKRYHNLATSLILALALLTSWGAQTLAGSKPSNAVRSSRGFNAADAARQVTIYRDEFGVPHIYGPTDATCV